MKANDKKLKYYKLEREGGRVGIFKDEMTSIERREAYFRGEEVDRLQYLCGKPTPSGVGWIA